MPSLESDILANLIRAKRDCLLGLREMGRRQRALVEGGEMTALVSLLAAKQKPLVQLQRVERALVPFRGQSPESRVWRSPAARRACADALAQCETLLAEIVHEEKYCEEMLVRRRDEAARELQSVHWAGATRQAYQAEPPRAIHQLDLLSER